MTTHPRFDGKTAIITGAGGRIGSVISHELAIHGAHVPVQDLDPAAAETVAGEFAPEAAPLKRMEATSPTPCRSNMR